MNQLSPEPLALSPADRGPTSEPPPSGRRILVIEDNHDLADTMRLLLELAGHEVAVAYDGRSGLALAREFAPDVLFCDIGLPGLDGWELARSLRRERDWDGRLMVAVSGYGREEDRRTSLSAGFDMHLVKPVDPAHLNELAAGARRAGVRG
jgi:two-component system CheB/CheR fusion protein